MTPLVPAADYTSAQRISAGENRERFSRGAAAAEERVAPLPLSHIRLVGSALMRAHHLTTRLMRLLARGIYLFPILLVAKIVLFAIHSWYGDLITVAFVVLVVAFFATLAAALLLHLMVGPRSQRAARSSVRLDLPHDADHQRILRALPTTARHRGRIQAGLAPGQPVIVERWLEHAGTVFRLLEGRCFAVVAEDEPPVVVDLAACPLLLAPYADSPSEPPPGAMVLARAIGNPGEGSARWCELRQGDMVEILAAVEQPIDRLDDDRVAEVLAATAEGGPYRAGRTPGVLVRSTLDAPVIIRRIDEKP